jgi:hypothetical protein
MSYYDYPDDMEEQREGILRWLFDACFGRRPATDDEFGEKKSMLGTINRLLKRH